MIGAERSRIRAELLEAAGHNLSLVPEALVELDCLTDSLMHRSSAALAQARDRLQGGARDERGVEHLAGALFGFPYVLPVSQGRLAEAILSKVLVRPGHRIPSSALFPTTRLHHERNGGSCVEVMTPGALDLASDDPFKGNLDLAELARAIEEVGPASVPLVCVEPCNNAVGGHPVSMANMRGIYELTARYRIPVYLDACRVIDNAVLIQQREPAYQRTCVHDIVLEFCSYASGCTLSATKDFVTPIGGFLATRDAELFEKCLDECLLLGNGLSSGALELWRQALLTPEDVFARIAQRVKRVKALHETVAQSCPVARPAGGHALFVNLAALELKVPDRLNPPEAFLYALFKDFGIRGAVNMQSRAQAESGIRLARFAIPIIEFTTSMLEDVARGIESVLASKHRLQGLERVSQPGGLTGQMRARYRPIEANP